jgi:hypothetical protein
VQEDAAQAKKLLRKSADRKDLVYSTDLIHMPTSSTPPKTMLFWQLLNNMMHLVYLLCRSAHRGGRTRSVSYVFYSLKSMAQVYMCKGLAIRLICTT